MWFANDFQSWICRLLKLLTNRLTHDPKIIIHSNSCIILYISIHVIKHIIIRPWKVLRLWDVVLKLCDLSDIWQVSPQHCSLSNFKSMLWKGKLNQTPVKISWFLDLSYGKTFKQILKCVPAYIRHNCCEKINLSVTIGRSPGRRLPSCFHAPLHIFPPPPGPAGGLSRTWRGGGVRWRHLM